MPIERPTANREDPVQRAERLSLEESERARREARLADKERGRARRGEGNASIHERAEQFHRKAEQAHLAAARLQADHADEMRYESGGGE